MLLTSMCSCLLQIDMQVGDIIVLATDGLYDNMFDEEIVQICSDAATRKKR